MPELFVILFVLVSVVFPEGGPLFAGGFALDFHLLRGVPAHTPFSIAFTMALQTGASFLSHPSRIRNPDPSVTPTFTLDELLRSDALHCGGLGYKGIPPTGYNAFQPLLRDTTAGLVGSCDTSKRLLLLQVTMLTCILSQILWEDNLLFSLPRNVRSNYSTSSLL